MNDRQILSYLGLARKAGKLAVGFAASKEACLKQKAKFVVIASDISQKSEKEIRFFSGKRCFVERIDATIEEVSSSIGTKAGIVAVCDEGFANALAKCIDSRND